MQITNRKVTPAKTQSSYLVQAHEHRHQHYQVKTLPNCHLCIRRNAWHQNLAHEYLHHLDCSWCSSYYQTAI